MPELNYFFIVWNGIRERSLCLKRSRLIKPIMRIGREDSNRFDDRIGLDKGIHNRFNCSEKNAVNCTSLRLHRVLDIMGPVISWRTMITDPECSQFVSIFIRTQLRLSLLNLFEFLINANGVIWIIGDLEWGTGSIFCSNHRNPRSYQLSYLETGSGRKISRLIETLDKRYLIWKGIWSIGGFCYLYPKADCDVMLELHRIWTRVDFIVIRI